MNEWEGAGKGFYNCFDCERGKKGVHAFRGVLGRTSSHRDDFPTGEISTQTR